MRPVALGVSVLLLLVAVLHLMRIVFQMDITVAGTVIPMWGSVVGCVVTGVLGVLLWRESRR